MNDKATNDSLIETSKSLVETNARLIAANDSLIKTNSSLIETNAQLIDNNETLKRCIESPVDESAAKTLLAIRHLIRDWSRLSTLNPGARLAQEIKKLLDETTERELRDAGVKLKEDGPFISIPFIHSREVLVKIIDELKYRLKNPFDCEDRVLLAFGLQLNSFIKRWKLDNDPHNFATLPKEN